ncbi:MAG: CHAT domain-containing protein, partial [Chitinophagales bacterium]
LDDSLVASIYMYYGRFLIAHKDYQKAFTQYTEILRYLNSQEVKQQGTAQPFDIKYLKESFLGYDLIKTLKTLSAILDLYAQHYKELSKVSINQILAYCRKSIDLIDHLRKTYSAERSKLILAEKAALIYDNTITILYRLYQETKEPILLEVIFECMEKSKAMVLLGTMQENTAKQQSGIPEVALKEEQRLRKRLTAYENALQKENTKKVKDEEGILELESGHFDSNEEYKKLIERFEQNYPNYHQLKYAIQTTAVEHLQQTITITTALVSYFVGKYHLTIFVVTKDEIYCEQLPIERKKLLSENGRKGLVKDFQKAINKSVYSRDVEQCAVYTQNAFACFDYLLAPIMDKLPENITTLRIIPDVVLGSIPFEALVTKMPNQDINSTYNQLRYLAHDYAIAYHYSATLWHYQQVQKSKTLVSQSSKQSKRFTGKYTAFVPSYEGTRYGNLSYTLTEAKSIGTMLADKNAMEQQFFVGENATKAAFEANCQESQVIVFAGHGNYNTKQPSKSGLIFTPIQKGKEDAEVLKLSEVYNLQLKANVVLLSACKSGKGDLAIGEGVMGVNRGFLYAGAKNVLFTLFNVPDESASELSTAFFRAVIEQPSLNYAKALQTAKKQLLSNSNYTPKHWSGLVLIGE